MQSFKTFLIESIKTDYKNTNKNFKILEKMVLEFGLVMRSEKARSGSYYGTIFNPEKPNSGGMTFRIANHYKQAWSNDAIDGYDIQLYPKGDDIDDGVGGGDEFKNIEKIIAQKFRKTRVKKTLKMIKKEQIESFEKLLLDRIKKHKFSKTSALLLYTGRGANLIGFEKISEKDILKIINKVFK